jgi:malic enzyme
LAAARATGSRLRDQRLVIVGAGSAGTGMSEGVAHVIGDLANPQAG